MNGSEVDALPQLPPRAPESHKGSYGTALIVAGSVGMYGAAALAGSSALRGGAGLVRVAAPYPCVTTVAGFNPCYTTIGLKADCGGTLSASAFDDIAAEAARATVVALGPGLGRSLELDRLVARLYQELPQPIVLDADGLNALATDPDALSKHAGPRVLTPHPGEFARLTGRSLSGAEREQAAEELAQRCGIVVLLKGHRTFITDGGHWTKNTTGNPGMATGGAGDVLTGLTTALWCQLRLIAAGNAAARPSAALSAGDHAALDGFDAARLAAHVHGRAGDLAAEKIGEVALIASDLLEFLPAALCELRGECRWPAGDP